MPQVCSYQLSQNCNKKPSKDKFFQIQLLDGTKHYVKQLMLKMVQPTQNSFECFGTGKQSGTQEFCANNDCTSDHPTKFCYYKKNEQTVFVSDFGTIPIKAWGKVDVQYYGEKDEENKPLHCIICEVQCIKGGVKIILNQDIVQQVSICSEPACYMIPHPKQEEIVMFPPVINLHEHIVDVKMWSKGFLIKHIGVNCKSDPYCEQISCLFCMSMLMNPQCAPRAALLLIFLIIFFGSFSIYVSLSIVKFVLKILSIMLKILAKIVKVCLRSCVIFYVRTKKKWIDKAHGHDDDQPEVDEIRNRRKPKTKNKLNLSYKSLPYMSMILVSLMYLPSSNSCSAVTTLTGTSKTCTVWKKDSDFLECVFNEVTRLAFVPQGQESCLMIKKSDTEPIGTLRIKTKQIKMKCQPENLYYTRSYKMNVEAVKRCPKVGMCTGEKCSKVKVNTKITELSEEANKSPGFSYCRDSCGCWGCSCFYCTSACLFYRTYATPITSTPFEVFACPVWPFVVDIDIFVDGASGTTTQHSMSLEPGIKIKWRNFEITLIGVISPPAPLLSTKFLTDGKRTIRFDAASSGQPIAGMIGSLQCPNEEKANKFECFLTNNVCQCIPQEENVSCTCEATQIESLFSDNESNLPLTTQGITISGQGKQLIAEFNRIASLELQVAMTDLRLTMLISKSTCKIVPENQGKINGCYSCLTGAKLHYTCVTDQGKALAHVECGEGKFSTPCNPDGHKGTATMTFSSADIKKNCTVVCPGETTSFGIEGTLIFIDKNDLNNASNIIGGIDTEGGTNVNFDFNHILNWLKDYWYVLLIMIICAIVLIILIVTFMPVIVNQITQCVAKIKNKIRKNFEKKGV